MAPGALVGLKHLFDSPEHLYCNNLLGQVVLVLAAQFFKQLVFPVTAAGLAPFLSGLILQTIGISSNWLLLD